MGIAATLVGLVAIALARQLPEGTATGGPGTRLLPTLVALIVAALGAAVAFRPPAASAAPGDADRTGPLRLGGTLAATVAYALAFERLGFLVATATFLVVLLPIHGERRWPVVAAVAVGATAATYAVFALWLRVPLPAGVLGP
jgi:putative tricarboxylic transport membrane protein